MGLIVVSSDGGAPCRNGGISLLDPGGVVQLEGTVGCQLRKSSLTSGGMSAPEIVVSGVVEWSSSDMGLSELLPSSTLSTPPFMCDTMSGFFLLNSAKASSTCTSFQLTHWFSESGYPFHLIRYCTLCCLPNFRDCRISSTSYSSSPSIGQEVVS